MNLLKYNNKIVKIIDSDNKTFISRAHYSDAETNESEEDVLILKTDNGYYEIYESEIKLIEILD